MGKLKINKSVKAGIGLLASIALLAWGGALIYALFTDPAHTWRYGLKLVMVAGLMIWVYDWSYVKKSEPDKG